MRKLDTIRANFLPATFRQTSLQIQSGQYRVGAVLGSGTELYIRRALPQLYRYMALMDSADEAFKQLQ